MQNNVTTLQHDLCVGKKFSIVWYIIADSNGTHNVSQSTLNGYISSLNNAFRPICVSFMNCSTVVIPHHPYNRWSQDTIDPIVTAQWMTQDVINVYIPDSIVGPPAGYAGSFIVLEKGVGSGVVIHEMGHFFSLPHTWDEIGGAASPPPPQGGSNEFVRRDNLKNCYTNGDGFCDTEADCYPVNKVNGAPCRQVHGGVDGYGMYYTPPVDNYMTYFTCGCKFTQEQYNQMALTALTSLFHLH